MYFSKMFTHPSIEIFLIF